MELPISNDILNNFNLKNHEYLVDPTYYDLPSGEQEYKLYSYLTTFFDNAIILDIGTTNGRRRRPTCSECMPVSLNCN